MSATKIRLTAVIMDVLDILTSSPSDNPAWGLRLCEATGYVTGTVYPALDRLMKAGWISDRWEDRPQRTGPGAASTRSPRPAVSSTLRHYMRAINGARAGFA